MSNEQMVSGRFYKLQLGRRKIAWIAQMFADGRKVAVCTYARPRIYSKVEQFKLNRLGSVYAQRGKQWDCIDGCGLSTY